jgi:large-conductance mechanosensitive channel
MNGPAQYVHAGFFLISVANLIIIALLVLVFVLAVALRRPGEPRISTLADERPDPDTDPLEEARP